MTLQKILIGLSLTFQSIAFAQQPKMATPKDSHSLFGDSTVVLTSTAYSIAPAFLVPDKISQRYRSLQVAPESNNFFLNNRRNRYSGLWAFASLNYLYADLAGLMDKNLLLQYQSGTVNGAKITPEFLTVAAAFMQIPISNVFLPQVIKNERTLKWVQIISGTVMTLVQAGTLFVGKPTPYYVLFSAVEIAATAYITIDAITWKAKKKVKLIE
jgi:hypothetical protein